MLEKQPTPFPRPVNLLSIVIPTYQRNDLLAGCLERLAPDVQGDRYEVIVSDDGRQSTAEAMIAAQFPWARWVPGPRRGPAANRNCGAAQALGEWLIFTDDDCLPESGWLAGYRAAIERTPGATVFEGRTYADRPQRSLAEGAPINEAGGNLWSCNFAVRTAVFRELGGFDERFPFAAMEDKDLHLRLLKAGHRPQFIAEAAICHPWKQIRGWKPIAQHQFSTLIYLLLHPDERKYLNPQFFTRATLKVLLGSTLPGLFRFKGTGLDQALREHLSMLKMALLLARHSSDRALADQLAQAAARQQLPEGYRLPTSASRDWPVVDQR